MCPSVQWPPDGLTNHAKKWFLGAGFLGAPPISLMYTVAWRREQMGVNSRVCTRIRRARANVLEGAYNARARVRVCDYECLSD